MELRFTVTVKIQKPVEEVFDGVYNPAKLSQYFATGGASGPLEEGTSVIWQFAGYPGEVPLQVKKVEKNRLIAFEWGAGEGVEDPDGTKRLVDDEGIVCRVEMKFEQTRDSTLVSISEWGWPATQRGLHLSYGNCKGWTEMACFLKAFLEYGINLRKGAY